MREEKLFEIEKRMENTEIAEYIRKIADKIEASETINLKAGDQEVNLETDRNAVFEVKVEKEGDEESLELEIEWEGSKSNDGLEIE